jgi:hypothetical protein
MPFSMPIWAWREHNAHRSYPGVDFSAVPVVRPLANHTIDVEKKSEGSDVVTLELCDSHDRLNPNSGGAISRAFSRLNPFHKERWSQLQYDE